MNINLPDNLSNDITNYCKINGINDIEGYIIGLIRKNHTTEKYQEMSEMLSNGQQHTKIEMSVREDKPVEADKKEINQPINVIQTKKTTKGIKIQRKQDDKV